MNWQNIKTKYPKAFEKLTAWYWGDMDFELLENGTLYFEQVFDGGKSYATSTLSFKDVVRGRKLYDFFDEQGIYGRVGKNQFMMFTWDLITDPEINICEFSDYDYNIRTEAEEALFLREFEILEEKL